MIDNAGDFKTRNSSVLSSSLMHTQAKERPDILNVGGFSDQVFNLIAEFARNNLTAEHWVGVIEKVEL